MTTFAIIGAGPGLGLASARRFGREGFAVALIARNREKLEALCDELESEGIRARAYIADVQDTASVVSALESAAAATGPIGVLQYSPVPSKAFLRPVLETRPEDLGEAVRFSLLGFAAAVGQVREGMTELGKGTILLVNGSSAVTPNGAVTGTSVAFAAESSYGTLLHDALEPHGIHVGQLIVPGAIGGGDPLFAPAALADQLWTMHVRGGDFRVIVGEG